MAYATTAKRKSAFAAPKTNSWDWDSEIRKETSDREKAVSDAARRFRNSTITK